MPGINERLSARPLSAPEHPALGPEDPSDFAHAAAALDTQAADTRGLVHKLAFRDHAMQQADQELQHKALPMQQQIPDLLSNHPIKSLLNNDIKSKRNGSRGTAGMNCKSCG